MSVRKSERGNGKLEVLYSAKCLAEYTLQACMSEKVFPKKSRWIMANRIVNECLDAISDIKKANSIRLENANAFQRYLHQQDAYGHLETMLALIDLAYNTFNIQPEKIEYWTGLIVETEIKLKAWIKSDKGRLVG